MDDILAAGSRFIAGNARLLEQRLHAACFLGGPADGIVDVLRGYQNGDGGFGHASSQTSDARPAYRSTSRSP
jgi:hypothetical protein